MKKINEDMLEKDIMGIISKMNNEGYFDEYSDEHFLLKSLNGKMDYFNRHRELIKGSHYISKDNKINATNFIMNFSTKFNWFYSHFNKKDMENFVKNQLVAGKKNYSDDQFFRALAEINVLNFLMCFGPNLNKAIYEPKLGKNGSNPEARLLFENDIVVDIEVKTPGFNREIKGYENGVLIPTFLLDDKEKNIFKKKCESKGFKFVLPRINKLKDYINSAGKKFEIPKDKKHINLLFINWTYTDVDRRGYVEPYSLLYNNLNGILKDKEAAQSIGINDEALKKITAIIVYQDSFDSLIFGDFRHVWEGYNFRMLPNMLMDKNLIDIELLKDVLRMNIPKKKNDMMPYAFVVKEKYLDEAIEVTEFINRRVKNKTSKEDNFIYFDGRYHNKAIKKRKKEEKRLEELRCKGYIM